VASKTEVEALVNELYQSWYPSLLGYATRSCGSLPLAEDLVQETLLSLCHDLLKGVEVQNPKGWTLTVLRHKISKHLDREKDRGLAFENLDIDAVSDKGPAGAGTAQALLAADELSHLLALLTRREEEVILLRLDGFKYAEIGAQLGIHVSSVKTLIARAIQKLQTRRTDAAAGRARLYVEPDAKTSRR
jgi:RNA polymerase sigma factor (sigma-70 family)